MRKTLLLPCRPRRGGYHQGMPASAQPTPPQGRFVDTRWSMVARAGGGDDAEARAALAWLVERYWEPLRRAARRWGCDEHQAEDAVQDFCCRLVERRADLGEVAPGPSRFRSWLLVVFRNALNDLRARQRAAKRGGGAVEVDARQADPPAPPDDHALFDRDWAEALLGRAVDRLAREHEGDDARRRFALLRPFLTANGSSAAYADAGRELGLGEGAVKVAVHRLRGRLRELARLEIRETLADPTPSEIDAELAALTEALAPESR
jgi:RNA polymerase sigma-70 factor (ECF subfamily)